MLLSLRDGLIAFKMDYITFFNFTSRIQPAITCSKLTIDTRRSGIFIVNFEHISHLVIVFLLLTLSRAIFRAIFKAKEELLNFFKSSLFYNTVPKNYTIVLSTTVYNRSLSDPLALTSNMHIHRNHIKRVLCNIPKFTRLITLNTSLSPLSNGFVDEPFSCNSPLQ